MCQKLYLFSYLNICRTILYMNVKFCGVCMCFQNYFRGTWVKGWMAPHIAMKHFWLSVEKCSIQSNPRRLCHLVACWDIFMVPRQGQNLSFIPEGWCTVHKIWNQGGESFVYKTYEYREGNTMIHSEYYHFKSRKFSLVVFYWAGKYLKPLT